MRLLIILYFLTCTFSTYANVQVQINGELFEFSENPRLTQVLAKFANKDQWYWPAAALYRLPSSKAEKQRNEIIDALRFAQLSLNSESSAQVKGLIEQIRLWTLADRVDVAIDYDAAQLNANNNPRFENGSYRLDLITRPQTASLFGLNTQTYAINLADSQCAHSYIKKLVPDLANLDFAYIIQPNGIIQKIGIAYWNSDCVDIMPGSQIYLPLAESQFFDQNRIINEKIVALARNRIVQ